MKFKQSIICSGIEQWNTNSEMVTKHLPAAGDVGLFEVMELGKHTTIQLNDRKNHQIFPGDSLMMAFGTRYATSQLHGLLPHVTQEFYHILGQGGVCGIVDSFNDKYELKGPTKVRLIGYVCDENSQVINTKFRNTERVAYQEVKINSDPRIILSIGGSMDSGKTTTAGHLCRGLKAAGNKVGFIKLTGTVYSKDVDFVVDCGADFGLDFGHCGFPSTYLVEEEEMLDLFETLLSQAKEEFPDYIVMEIADGIYQRETNMLLKSDIMNRVEAIIYSDSNSTGAVSGLELLKGMHLSPFALCGCITTSPLMVQEVKNYSSVPVLTLNDLIQKSIVSLIKPHGLKPSLQPTEHLMFRDLSEAI